MNQLNIPPDADFDAISSEENASGYKITPKDLELSDELLEMLPETIQKATRYASEMTDSPRTFFPLAFIALIGGLIGNKRLIKLGGITIYPVIWTIICAQSSMMRKTTQMGIAKSFFKAIIEKWVTEYTESIKRWEADKKLADETNKEFDKPKPIKRWLYAPDGFSDLTFWQTLQENSSLVSFVTEFTALIKQLGKTYTGMGDFILSLYDAEDNMRRVTRMGGDITLKNPVWCMVGATTVPALRSALSSTDRGNGFLQRILPITYEGETKFKAMTELPSPDLMVFAEVSNHLLSIAELSRKDMELSPEASQLFTDWSHELFNRSRDIEDQVSDIGGYSSRLNAYGLKFALIFQVLTDPDQPISAKNMRGAIALCDWCFKHQIYMLTRNYIFNRFYSDRMRLLEVLEKNAGIMSRTDLMNLTNFDKEQLDRALDNEIEAGHIEAIKIETGGRPRFEYKLSEGGSDAV